MNIIFLTLLDFKSFDEHNIYCDLLREFIKNGHNVYCISPAERRTGVCTHFEENGCLLKLRIGNMQKTNILEKGISTVMVEPQIVSAIKRYFSNIKFDLVLYSTPPITFANAVKYIKKRDGAKSYLMLKDIFPQNAIDIGMLSKKGIRGLIYKYFRKKEKELYSVSDCIGCMSQANVDYVLANNPEISTDKVEVCPNSIEIQDVSLNGQQRVAMRKKYDIPRDKKVFVYGGNLGKPQGIQFLIECLESQMYNDDAFFLIIGDGTEYGKVESFFNQRKPKNMKLMRRMPKDDYDRMIAACDVGMIFLNYQFTIPNFPSRLLSYMQAGLPVLACTDPNTDIGSVITSENFGWWCASNSVNDFNKKLTEAVIDSDKNKNKNAKKYLSNNYSVTKVYHMISERMCNENSNDK